MDESLFGCTWDTLRADISDFYKILDVQYLRGNKAVEKGAKVVVDILD